MTGWDCHAHVFGPYDRYPLAPERSYTPPEATAEGYASLLERLELAHGVLVHPSAYGEDHGLLFDTLRANPRWRGVVVARAGANLDGLGERGIRGARFSHRSGAGANFAGSASLHDLGALANALAQANLHAELWTDTRALPDIADALRALPVPVVIDHMGGFDVDAGLDDPGFRTLLQLLESGGVWVKLCAYRNVRPDDPDRARPFHRAMIEANADRLVWGSDWPHLRVEPRPDAARWLQRLRDWTNDAALVERILVHNPAALYQ